MIDITKLKEQRKENLDKLEIQKNEINVSETNLLTKVRDSADEIVEFLFDYHKMEEKLISNGLTILPYSQIGICSFWNKVGHQTVYNITKEYSELKQFKNTLMLSDNYDKYTHGIQFRIEYIEKYIIPAFKSKGFNVSIGWNVSIKNNTIIISI